MTVQKKFTLYAFIFTVIISLSITSFGVQKFVSEVKEKDLQLFSERLGKIKRIADGHQNLYYEGFYDQEETAMENVIDDIKAVNSNNNSYYVIVTNNKGELIYHPFMEQGGKLFSKNENYKNIIGKDTGILSDVFQNNKYHFFFLKYPVCDWIFYYAIKTSDQYRSIYSFIVYTSVFTILIMTAFIVLLYFTIRRAFLPVRTISMFMKSISEGEADLTKKIEIRTKDEFGQLADNFNKFIDKLMSLASRLKDVSRKSNTIGNDLAASTEETSSTLEEINATILSINEKIQFLGNEIVSTGKATDKIAQLIQNLYKITNDQSASVNQSSSAIHQMVTSINALTGTTEIKKQSSDKLTILAKDGEEGMRHTVSLMEEISRSTSAIAEMIKVINNVAEQTNLLAMNAAIEAAHAGEFGKGFSVVADEIRKLAEATGDNAKSISGTLKGITDKIKAASEFTSATGKKIQNMILEIVNISEGINEMSAGMREMSQGSNEINIAMADLLNITSSVRSVSDEINSIIVGINDSMIQIRNISTENKSGMSEIANGMNEIYKAMTALSQLSIENSKNIEVIDSEVIKFKTTQVPENFKS